MTITTVYKITTKDCKSALSLAKRWLPDMTVTYSTEHWSVANSVYGIQPPLFVFGSLEKASHFFHISLDYNSQWVIWEAQATNIKEKKNRLPISDFFTMTNIYNFWKRIYGYNK